MPLPSETKADGLAAGGLAASSGAGSTGQPTDQLTISQLASASFVLEVLVAKAASTSHFKHTLAIEKKLSKSLSIAWDSRLKKGLTLAAKQLSTAQGSTDASGDFLATLQSAFIGWSKVASPILRAATAESYRLGKKRLYKRASEVHHAVAKAKKPQKAEIKPHFSLPDEKAIEASTKNMLMWLGDFTDKDLPAAISGIVESTILASGTDLAVAAEQLEAALGAKFGFNSGAAAAPTVPTKFNGDVHDYLSVVSSYAATVSSNIGMAQGLKELGITQYTIENPEDERTCPLCGSLSGQVFETQQMLDQVDAFLGAETIDGVKAALPWATGAEADKPALDASGFKLPPYHGRCRCGLDIASGTVLTFS